MIVTRIRRWRLEKLSWSFPVLALQLLFSTCLHFCLLHFHYLVPILTFELHMDKLGHKETWKVLLLFLMPQWSIPQTAFFTVLRASPSSSGMLTWLLWLWYTVVIMFCGEIHLGLMLALFVALINLTGSATACQMPPLPTSWPHTHPVRLPFTHTSHNDIFKDYSNAWYSVQKVVCLWFAPFQLLLFRFPDENYTEAFNCVLKILINHSVSISHILQVWDNHSHCVTVSHFNSFICYIHFYVEFLNS